MFFACLSICVCVLCLSACPGSRISVLYVCLSVCCLSVCLSICLSVYLFCLSACLSVLSLYLSAPFLTLDLSKSRFSFSSRRQMQVVKIEEELRDELAEANSLIQRLHLEIASLQVISVCLSLFVFLFVCLFVCEYCLYVRLFVCLSL